MGGEGGWTCGRDGLRYGPLLVSFQRFARSAGGVVAEAPRSLGALPVAAAEGRFLLPAAPAEGFWIGAILAPAADLPMAELIAWPRANGPRYGVPRRGDPRHLASLWRPQTAIIAGMIRPDGRFDIFSRESLAALDVRIDGAAAQVAPVDPADYAAITGEPLLSPLDPSAGYGGWRLP
jgi:hypothetical protein